MESIDDRSVKVNIDLKQVNIADCSACISGAIIIGVDRKQQQEKGEINNEYNRSKQKQICSKRK